jgi:sulfide:quinone oxidoreductase
MAGARFHGWRIRSGARSSEQMATRIVIIGGGTGGTLMANRLRGRLDDAEITVVDADDRHLYQPGLLFVPFGLADPDELARSRAAQFHAGITFVLGSVARVDPEVNRVNLLDGSSLDYDVLIVASGATLQPEETDGLASAFGRSAFTFYTLDGAVGLRDALASFAGGQLLVNVVDMPIKCPVAPLEFAFLADWFLQRAGIRDRTDITFVTPLEGAFTKPVASARLGQLLAEKRIAVRTEFATGGVDAEAGRLVSWDEREVAFDLLVTVPVHGGAPFVTATPGLGDELGFVVCDPHTLQAKLAPNIFAIGDATNLPTSKAGSVTHFEADTLVENVTRFLAGDPLEPSYDGHANCFVESGFHKALLIDFNYDVEPLPGRFPEAHIGPLPLLEESRLNHMAKLLFQWMYWNVLLPGREIPGVSAQLQLAGKQGVPQ